MKIYKPQNPIYRNGQTYFYDENFNSWCWATQMNFIVEGVKAKPHSEYLSETDLLTDEVKSIRRRQRQKITTLRHNCWVNLSDKDKKPLYNRAKLYYNNIWAN